jgi:hypothetical protein
MAVPALQKGVGVLAFAAGLVVEDDDGRPLEAVKDFRLM